jgi:hypothetical protein
MKVKTSSTLLFFLFFLPAKGYLQNKLIVDVQKDSLYVKAEVEGQEGWRGCHWETCRPATAYYFLLYKGEERGNLLKSRKTNTATTAFPRLPAGTYRLECWYGKPLGCRILDQQGREKGRSNIYFCVSKTLFLN